MNRVQVYEALLSILLIVSVATAVPQSQSSTVMNIIGDIEQERNTLEEKQLNFETLDPQASGIFDLLKQLIWLIIKVIMNLIDIIKNLIGLVALIEYLIQLIMVLVDSIIILIDMIMNIFNPSLAIAK